ncbi:MAG: phosphoglycolate phosphatase [Bacteroidetes bacterium 4572_77]|nr:MAG: phosphoglycolate phosphatase [Bacteroidetes bacterium 4572_77]
MIKAVLFDLDGTITDPKEGILNSIMYAVKKMGFEEKNKEELVCFIGPPLHISFQKRYGVSEQKSYEMVKAYREYYAQKGIFECYLYKGVLELLEKLRLEDVLLSLATSKPIYYANQLLQHFQIDHYFDFVAGSNMDGSRTDKKEVIAYALENIPSFEPDEILMLGDREFDIEGGQYHQLATAWAKWGYGLSEDILRLKPNHLIDSPVDLLGLWS